MSIFHEVEKILKILNTWQSIHLWIDYFSDILKIIVEVVTFSVITSSQPRHAVFIYD